MRLLRINLGSITVVAEAAMAAVSRLFFYLPFSWRGLSALVLGVLLAKWFWILFAPHPIYTASAPANLTGLEAGQLFGKAASVESISQGVALPNVQLLGVFAASAGKPGFAILKLDDKRQVGVAEGQEVASGTKLLAVHADHVVLEHGGVQQKVILENKYAGSKNLSQNNIPQPSYGAAAGNKPESTALDKSVKNRLLMQYK